VSQKDTKGESETMNFKMSPKALRVNAKMEQKEVAEYLNLSLTQYKRKENGHARWYADEIYKLSRLYKVPVGIFFTNEVSLKDTTKVE